MRRGASDHRGRSGLPARLSLGLGATMSAVSLFDCSLLLNWDYTGGTGGSDSDGQAGDELGGEEGATDAGVGLDASFDAVRGLMRCVSTAPAGWSGPMALYLGPPQSPLPDCAPDYPTPTLDGYEGFNTPSPTCSSCTCTAPQGASCSPPDLTPYSDLACQQPCGSPVPLTVAGCVSPSCTFTSFTVSAATIDDAGTCAQGGGTPAMDQPTWSHAARLCAPLASPSSGSCKMGEVLVPLPAMPLRLCIMAAGETSCPNGPFTRAFTVYSQNTFNDTRGCSPCTCDPPTGGSCPFSTPYPQAGYAYPDSKCGTLGGPVIVPTVFPFIPPTSCRVFTTGTQGPPLYFKLVVDAGLDPGSCAPSGGKPTGMVAPTGSSSTLCCIF